MGRDFIFVLVLVREMYVIYKSKRTPRGALFSDDNIAVYCITAVFVDGPFKNAVADDFGIG